MNTEKRSSVQSTSSVPHGVGRRKSSVARVWLKRGKGDMKVNGKGAREYFTTENSRVAIAIPGSVCPLSKNYDVIVNVRGGGVNSQADAVKLALSRALVTVDESMRSEFKQYRLLTVDARLKERKKPGQRGARRKFQFVKR